MFDAAERCPRSPRNRHSAFAVGRRAVSPAPILYVSRFAAYSVPYAVHRSPIAVLRPPLAARRATCAVLPSSNGIPFSTRFGDVYYPYVVQGAGNFWPSTNPRCPKFSRRLATHRLGPSSQRVTGYQKPARYAVFFISSVQTSLMVSVQIGSRNQRHPSSG